MGASRLIIAVRTISKGEEANNKIVQATGGNAASITVMQLDMSTFASVKTFADKLAAEIEQLDIALLNAGIAAFKYMLGPEGFEAALQVSSLSTALLAILLLPKLRSTAASTGHPSQITFTRSVAHLDITAKDLRRFFLGHAGRFPRKSRAERKEDILRIPLSNTIALDFRPGIMPWI